MSKDFRGANVVQPTYAISEVLVIVLRSTRLFAANVILLFTEAIVTLAPNIHTSLCSSKLIQAPNNVSVTWLVLRKTINNKNATTTWRH